MQYATAPLLLAGELLTNTLGIWPAMGWEITELIMCDAGGARRRSPVCELWRFGDRTRPKTRPLLIERGQALDLAGAPGEDGRDDVMLRFLDGDRYRDAGRRRCSPARIRRTPRESVAFKSPKAVTSTADNRVRSGFPRADGVVAKGTLIGSENGREVSANAL